MKPVLENPKGAQGFYFAAVRVGINRVLKGINSKKRFKPLVIGERIGGLGFSWGSLCSEKRGRAMKENEPQCLSIKSMFSRQEKSKIPWGREIGSQEGISLHDRGKSRSHLGS